MAEKRVDFKSMTKQEKRDYIWYYYKNHMLIGLFSIVLIGSLVYDVASKNQIVFSLTLFGESDAVLELEEIQQTLTEVIVPNGSEKEKVLVQFYGLHEVQDTFDEITDLYQQKMLTQIAAQELDLVVMSESDFNFYSQENMFDSLDELEGINWGLISDKQLIKDSKVNKIYGIKLIENELLNEINYESSGKVIALVKNSLNKDKAVQVINYLLRE